MIEISYIQGKTSLDAYLWLLLNSLFNLICQNSRYQICISAVSYPKEWISGGVNIPEKRFRKWNNSLAVALFL
jgi:hypothetical protein